MTKTLILSSDLKLLASLKVCLSFSGFEVFTARTLLEGEKLTEGIHFELILADFHGQNSDVFKSVKPWTERGRIVPVIYFAERAYQEALTIRCSGKKDYLLKPFSLQHLKGTINNVLLQARAPEIELDQEKRFLKVRNRVVTLGKIEMKIFLILRKKSGQMVSVDKIQKAIEEEGIRMNLKIYYHISNLRRHLDEVGFPSLTLHFIKGGCALSLA